MEKEDIERIRKSVNTFWQDHPEEKQRRSELMKKFWKEHPSIAKRKAKSQRDSDTRIHHDLKPYKQRTKSGYRSYMREYQKKFRKEHPYYYSMLQWKKKHPSATEEEIKAFEEKSRKRRERYLNNEANLEVRLTPEDILGMVMPPEEYEALMNYLLGDKN